MFDSAEQRGEQAVCRSPDSGRQQGKAGAISGSLCKTGRSKTKRGDAVRQRREGDNREANASGGQALQTAGTKRLGGSGPRQQRHRPRGKKTTSGWCCAVRKGKACFSHYGAADCTAAISQGRFPAAAKPDDSFYYRPIKLLERTEELEEEQIEQMIQSGVTVLEDGAWARSVSAVTQNHGGEEDNRSFANQFLVLMIDDIIRSVRERLSQLIRGGRTLFSPDSVASLAVVVLDEKKQAGYLSEFEPPVVYEQEQDPSVCVVELEFRLVSVLSRIYLTAHISL